MTIKMENIGQGNRAWHDLWELFDAFGDMRVDSVKIEFSKNDYKSTNSCYSSIKNALNKQRRPVDIVMIDGELYLVSKI